MTKGTNFGLKETIPNLGFLLVSFVGQICPISAPVISRTDALIGQISSRTNGCPISDPHCTEKQPKFQHLTPKVMSTCNFSRHGSGDEPPPGWSKEMTRDERRKLKRDQRKKQMELEKRRKVQEEHHGRVSGGNGNNFSSVGGGRSYLPLDPGLEGEGDGGGDDNFGFQPPVEIGNGDLSGSDGSEMQGELTAVSLERKYSYAIMALSVVVLAVLMVATIFCCNSSNSTMAQAANARAALATQNATAAGGAFTSGGVSNAGVVGGAQFDNYSIYSYKGIGGNMGTFGHTAHATGGGGMDTLGGASLRTETLKSTRSMASRASPQYRVSDIDPEFARRFDRDNQHY